MRCLCRSRHSPVEHGRRTSGRQARPPQSAPLQARSAPLLQAQRKLLGDVCMKFVIAASTILYKAMGARVRHGSFPWLLCAESCSRILIELALRELLWLTNNADDPQVSLTTQQNLVRFLTETQVQCRRHAYCMSSVSQYLGNCFSC